MIDNLSWTNEIMNAKNLDTDYLRQWIGNKETIEETISAEPLLRMAATLDREPRNIVTGDEVPALWHWAYFLTPARASELGRDGHAALGDFMPPVPLPRRMWAGGKLDFIQPLRVGDLARKESSIRDVTLKQGRTGRLCFVEVEHRIFVGEELRFSETHNIVYRDAQQAGEDTVLPPKAPNDRQWTREVTPNSTLLFRYSALTFNGHRIHYDLDFCRHQEGYPGLVFHGPLTVTLLLELAMENNPGRSLKSCEFRAYSPLFDNAPFTLNGKMDHSKAEMWAANPDNRLAMEASISF
ncbi:MAG: MaoC family dehydratase N-terminal domain-containing protein [Gammaproteobacteria bacterium]|nr:MaoC family dehydratase N-terminal domain-containing protein [Gammaproteobacteria bacterium]